MKTIDRLAIANRGEVAVRIIHACKELGIETVLLHSEADVKTLAYRLCDKPVCIGPAAVNHSYLNIEANIQGALSADAEAIHPGFGFLSENANFARECEKHNLIFVGPNVESIELFGDKISAKNLVQKVGVKTVPGYQGENQETKKLIEECERIGFPVIVKAAAGGGGRGMKIVRKSTEAEEAIESAKREAVSAFGSPIVFLEKYLDQAKHIEVQIFGDHMGNIYHLYERECSVQRRHQKVIEESLAAVLSDSLRDKILQDAINIGRAAKYKGAGTIEFLVQDDDYFFMEMNTRLQVEHPVTEMVMGVDLVKAQILTASQRGPLWTQGDLIPRGHAIECRVYAEDPYHQGIPSTGPLGGMFWPQGPGRRFDFGIESGDEVTPFYDSMIAKIIVWDETRIRAIQKMRRTLQETVIFGIKTNIPYLLAILEHHEFISGKMTTQFISKYFPSGLKHPTDCGEEIINKIKTEISQESSTVTVGGKSNSTKNPWAESVWEKI
ncbi:MAG: ATP-grasp domain-containing protein [Bdellovibrionaceae bacterium]|nr:ATP-grasp domain-containing protein [Pseudobdellovibrionaceae bacterium]